MAVNTTGVYFNNAIVGQMQVGADAKIHEINTNQKFPIGQGFTRSDGAKYRYSHYGLAVSAGQLVSQDISESSTGQAAMVVVAPGSAQAIPNESNITAGSIGSRFIEVTVAAVAAGQYAGGHLTIASSTGAGYTFRIRGNSATGDPTSGNIRLELYQPLTVAVAAATELQITGSMYSNLEPATASTDLIISGVSQAANTAQTWGWTQTHGPCAVLQDGSINAGDMCTLSDSISGAIQAAAGGDLISTAALIAEAYVGYCILPSLTTTDFGTFYLQLQ